VSGEIHVDRVRLPEDEAVILQARNMSVGIDAEILRRRTFRIWPDRHVLVGMPISSSIHNTVEEREGAM